MRQARKAHRWTKQGEVDRGGWVGGTDEDTARRENNAEGCTYGSYGEKENGNKNKSRGSDHRGVWERGEVVRMVLEKRLAVLGRSSGRGGRALESTSNERKLVKKT